MCVIKMCVKNSTINSQWHVEYASNFEKSNLWFGKILQNMEISKINKDLQY